jgi:competence protein ComEC
VAIAAALIVGAACGGARPEPVGSATAALLAIGMAVRQRRRPRLKAALAAFAALAIGSAVQGFAWRAAGNRIDATFGGARSKELEVVGRLLAAPERRSDGGRALELATNTAPALRLRLAIAAIPADDATRLDGLRRGDTIRVWCRLRAPEGGPGRSANDARRGLAAERLDATGRVKSSRLVRLITLGSPSPGRALDDARVRARGALDRAVGSEGETRAVIGAMLLGDRFLLSEETQNVLREAGLVHILSISGLHTALSIVLLLALLRRAGLGARGVAFAGGAGIVAFSTFVGHGASVLRACASLGVGLTARLSGRDVEPLAGLALAAATLVLAVPALAWNAGFLLSVTATAGLLAAPPGSSAFGRALAISTGAYLATVPLLAARFGRLAPAAFVANFAAAPLCAFCLAAGAAAIACASIPVAGDLAAGAAKSAVSALMLVSKLAGMIPGGHLRVARPHAILALTYVALLVATDLANGGANHRLRRVLRLTLALCAIAIHLGPPPPGPDAVAIELLDVGQGLAVVVRGPDGGFVLSDAGPSGNGQFDAGDRIVVPALVDQGCRRLEVFALSHDHDDHAGGALAVLRDLDVGELWVGEGSELDPLTQRVLADAVARGVAVRRLKRGDEARRAGLTLSVLHPGVDDRSRSLNDRCLVLHLGAPNGSAVLLPGDLEAAGERALLASHADPQASVLVAPHHGANGSSTAAFLARVAPRFVLVSAGEDNRFGHPGQAALARFADAGAKVLRTDRDGTIVLRSNASSWLASVEKDRHGDEREDEDQGERDREEDAPPAERTGLVEKTGVTVPQYEQNHEPQAVCGRRSGDHALDDDEHRESADGRER